MNKILKTDRLILRELNSKDAEFILKLVNSPKWIKFIGDRNIHSVEDAEQYIINGPVKSYKENNFGLWIVLKKNSQTPIGMCGLLKREYLKHPDIGIALLLKYEGSGYGYEAATATISYEKENLNLPLLSAISVEYNNHSINLLQKLRFNFEKNITIPNNDEVLLLFEKLLI